MVAVVDRVYYKFFKKTKKSDIFYAKMQSLSKKKENRNSSALP